MATWCFYFPFSAVIDFMCNEAVNNYFYQGNPPLLPNGSLAGACKLWTKAGIRLILTGWLISKSCRHTNLLSGVWLFIWIQLSLCPCFKITFMMRSWPLCCSLNPETVSENGGKGAALNEGWIFKTRQYRYNMKAVAIAVCCCFSRMFLQKCISCAFIYLTHHRVSHNIYMIINAQKLCSRVKVAQDGNQIRCLW